MNDKARELLVKAALDGVKQARGAYEYGQGLCAMGVLGFRSVTEGKMTARQHFQLLSEYGLTEIINYPCECQHLRAGSMESSVIMHLNDHHGWDFLQIARKVGVKESQE